MKILFAMVLAVSSSFAFAGKDWDKLPFDQQKKMMQEKLEKKSSMLQENQTCVNNASDKNALKACKESMKEQKQAMKDEWKQKKKQSMEEVEKSE